MKLTTRFAVLVVQRDGHPTYGGGWQEYDSFDAILMHPSRSVSRWFVRGAGKYRATAVRMCLIAGVRKAMFAALNAFDAWIEQKLPESLDDKGRR